MSDLNTRAGPVLLGYRSVSFFRIAAMVLRYWYLIRGSWPRFIDIIYWPAVPSS